MIIVGLSGFFWLYMNWGRYTESWKKMVLTVVNLGCIGLACAIVCPFFFIPSRVPELKLMQYSIVWSGIVHFWQVNPRQPCQLQLLVRE